MNAKKNALGRGLSALIEDSTIPKEIVQAVEASNEIELSLIEVNPFQPRKDFDEEALRELAISIQQLGIIQPITLRQLDNNRYQIIAGERRFRAAKLAGLDRVPAFIRSADDQGMLELALVENIHRADLNSIEVAISYQRLIDECSLTQESLSDRVGKKRATIANYLRLLRLPAEIQLGIREEKLTMGHARALITIDDMQRQLDIYHQVVNEGLSVREVEEIVRTMNEPVTNTGKTEKKEKSETTGVIQEYEDLRHHLSKHFNSSVDFKRNSNGAGKIIISFKSDEDLERIISKLDTISNS
jgi:ParB family transcriptional regulator, chromosome partitioning protein